VYPRAPVETLIRSDSDPNPILTLMYSVHFVEIQTFRALRGNTKVWLTRVNYRSTITSFP